MNLNQTLPGAVIHSLPPIPGSDGVLAMNGCLEKKKDVAQIERPDFILVEAVTGCGKSKVLPPEYALMLMDMEEFHGNLLVLTTAAKDVQDGP